MTPKEIYCMGRAEYLSSYKGYSLTEGYKIAEKEWNKKTMNSIFSYLKQNKGEGEYE